MQFLSERLDATRTKKPRGESGSKGAHQEDVAAAQRARILTATEELLAERGCAGTTIERIAKRARVSSITFYDHFETKEDAFVAAFDRTAVEACARLAAEVPGELPWPERIREGLRALLALIAEQPQRATACLVESQKGGAALLTHYETVLDGAALQLRRGRQLDAAAEDLPGALEETVAAGIAWLLRERLETDGAEGIEELLPRLADIALAPYLGEAEALHLVSPSSKG